MCRVIYCDLFRNKINIFLLFICECKNNAYLIYYNNETNRGMKRRNLISKTAICLYLVLALVITSCSTKTEGYFKKETINTEFKIQDITTYKYSGVKGYIIYNGIKVHVDNGLSGYHYKKYKLSEGQTIKVTVNIYYYSTPYGYELRFRDIDVSKYELN